MTALLRGSMFRRALWLPLLLVCSHPAAAQTPPTQAQPAAQAPPAAKIETPAERGYRWLTTKTYLPPDFSQDVFDDLWQNWPAAWKAKAEQASAAERRKLAFEYYGLVEAPGRNGGPALGYVDDGKGNWVMNCLACHSGTVAGQRVLGAPNSNYALANLTDDVTKTKKLKNVPLGHMELGALGGIPLGGSNGTTNAVVFGVALESFRDQDLNFRRDFTLQKLVHHDLDAPPFWNVKRKTHLYYDAFIKKGHRSLLQFILLPQHGANLVKSWEGEYRDILAWIESLEPPKYPYPIDLQQAATGEEVFSRHCARCHGTYGKDSSIYPNKVVPLGTVKTDPVRLEALSVEYRKKYGESWLAHYQPADVRSDPGGYLAPPLDGIWASAPYLHNGSVPTLWHLLHPQSRPTVWKRTSSGYDTQRVGLEATALDGMPGDLSPAESRQYFDTRLRGKSAAGHDFPARLSPGEKAALLEYLKTL